MPLTSMSHSNYISGSFYDGKTSTRQSGRLHVNENGYVEIDGVAWEGCDFNEVSISSRIGNASRTIYFPDGALFESNKNDEIDALIRKYASASGLNVLHKFESKLRYIVASVVIVAAAVFSFINYGIPAISKSIAYSVSPSISIQLASESLIQLDSAYFKRTELSLERRESLTKLFNQNLPEDEGFNYQLHFRKGDRVGANAFALPDGSVVVTDELIELADNDEEILAVLYHEMGHVYHRHSLRQVIQSVGVLVVFAWVAGDVEMISDWSVALPAFLVQAKYSRDIESEADDYALSEMIDHNVDPIHFAEMMKKLEKYALEHKERFNKKKDSTSERKEDETAKKTDEKSSEENAVEEKDPGKNMVFKILSSHPVTKERILKFERASEKLK